MDFITDKSNKIVKRVTDSLSDLPENIKEAATALQEEDWNAIASSAFADPIRRELPITTKEATCWSGLYLALVPHDDPRVLDRVKQAARRFGVDVWLQQAEDQLSATFKKSASAVKYALVVEQDGEQTQYYPVDDDLLIEESAKQAVRDYTDGRLPLELLVDTSQELVKAASAYTPAPMLPDLVLSYGEVRLPERTDVVRALEKRAALTQDEAYTYILDALPESLDRDTAKQAADMTFRLDMDHNLDYTSGALRDPYKSFFSGPRVAQLKQAANNYFMVDDLVLPVDVVTRLPESDIGIWCAGDKVGDVKSAIKQASAGNVAGLDRVFGELDPDSTDRFIAYLNAQVND